MKPLTLLFAVLLASCASRGITHTSQFVDVVLSPQHPADAEWHLTLVSVSHSGYVRVRGPQGANGAIYSARVGERFHIGDGASLDCVLKSVDTQTGRVTISCESRIYY